MKETTSIEVTEHRGIKISLAGVGGKRLTFFAIVNGNRLSGGSLDTLLKKMDEQIAFPAFKAIAHTRDGIEEFDIVGTERNSSNELVYVMPEGKSLARYTTLHPITARVQLEEYLAYCKEADAMEANLKNRRHTLRIALPELPRADEFTGDPSIMRKKAED